MSSRSLSKAVLWAALVGLGMTLMGTSAPLSAEEQPSAVEQAAPADVAATPTSTPTEAAETKAPPAADSASENAPGDAAAESETTTDTAGTEPETPENATSDQATGEKPTAEETAAEGETTGTEEATTTTRLMNGLMLAAILVLVFVVPIVVGNFLARQWNVPNQSTGISLILFCVIASVVVLATRWPPKLGIDLSGGVIMVYEIEEPTAGGTDTPNRSGSVDMDQLIAALSKRVNPSGVKEVTIRRYGPKQIEIIVPEVDEDEVARLERIISSVGTLEFRILANRRDHQSLIERAMQLPPDEQELRDENGQLLAWWVPIAKGKEDSIGSFGEIALREGQYRNEPWLQVLVVKDRYDITGEDLARVSEGVDETGSPAVDFQLKAVPAQRFADLTGANAPDPKTGFKRRLGIILDGFMHSAPNLKSEIGARGQISGDFTREEVRELLQVLQAGSLPAQLSPEPISRLITGPQLGRDTIEQSVVAMAIAAVLVFAFMIFYYRFAGIVASLAVVMNLLMLVAIMILIQAAFTLPGLAGVTLTVGMAVDANVLIYERIREELDRKATLRMAIRNGFAKAMSAIVDSNVTTLITAVVLYVVGTDQVKGFAVTLFLGVSLSLFTAVYCARIVFEIAERRRWITKLTMMRLIDKTNINFMAAKNVAMALSGLLILTGMVAVYQRGSGLLDIDFTGGVALETYFTEPQDIADIRRELKDLRDLAVSDVRLQGEEPGRRFMINTSSPPGSEAEAYLQQVKDKIAQTFGKKLVHYSVEIQPISASSSSDQSSWLPRDAAIAGAMFATLQDGETDTTSADDSAPATNNGDTGNDVTEPESPPADSSSAASNVTRARLVFEHKISYEGVEELLQAAIGDREIRYEISNESYRRGDTESYKEWEVMLDTSPEEGMPILNRLKEEVENTPYFPSSNTIGGKVAVKTRWLAMWALIGSLFCIVGYLWVRFTRVSYGLAAVVALVHDVLTTLSMIALSAYVTGFLGFLLINEFKIGLSVLAAFLTIIGYSLNDTIIVFDRIREIKGKSPYLSGEMINNSVNQTLSRTLITSLTTLFVVLVLYIGGGAGIHAFSFALVVGVIVGTYSSIYIASPVLLWFSPKPPEPNGNGRKLKHIS
ncbi:protein translocase subunit SecD [Thermostilla marina]